MWFIYRVAEVQVRTAVSPGLSAYSTGYALPRFVIIFIMKPEDVPIQIHEC